MGGWVGLGWAGLGWAGLGWVGLGGWGGVGVSILTDKKKSEDAALIEKGGSLKMLNMWANGMTPHDEEDGA